MGRLVPYCPKNPPRQRHEAKKRNEKAGGLLAPFLLAMCPLFPFSESTRHYPETVTNQLA